MAADRHVGRRIVRPAPHTGDPPEHCPEGAQQLWHQGVSEGRVQQLVEFAVEFGERATCPAGLLHPFHHGLQPRQLRVRERARDPPDEPLLQDLPDLEYLGQRARVVALLGQRAEGQAVDERGQRRLADVGAVAVSDLHDVEGLECLECLADGVAADAEGLHQFGLGGQGRTGPEPAVEDQLHDLALDLAAHPRLTDRARPGKRVPGAGALRPVPLGPAFAARAVVPGVVGYAPLRHAPHRTRAGHPTSHLPTGSTVNRWLTNRQLGAFQGDIGCTSGRNGIRARSLDHPHAPSYGHAAPMT